MGDSLDDGGPLSPQIEVGPDGMPRITEPGLSVRDYFAGQALIGMLASWDGWSGPGAAWKAYEYADAMIAARASHPSQKSS